MIYFFNNIPKTPNWQFLQLDLEFSSTQRTSFCRYIPIWRRPIWMVVFTKQVHQKLPASFKFIVIILIMFCVRKRLSYFLSTHPCTYFIIWRMYICTEWRLHKTGMNRYKYHKYLFYKKKMTMTCICNMYHYQNQNQIS